MPLRTLVRLLGIYLACLGIVGIAGAVGSELHMFPLRRHPRPPTSPWVVAILLAIPGIAFPLSRRWALQIFTGCTLLVALGSFFGWAMFSWTPSWAQHFLSATMIVATCYGWQLRDDYMDY